MSKLKMKKSNGKIIVYSKLSADEQVNERELLPFSQNLLSEFFRPKIVNEKKILYFASSGRPLAQVLKQSVSVELFFSILAQIVRGIQTVENRKFMLKNLVLHQQQIIFNETSQSIQMLYQPIISSETRSNPAEFIMEILHTTVFDSSAGLQPVIDFIRYYKGIRTFSPADILQAITRVCPSIRNQLQAANGGVSSSMMHSGHWQEPEDDAVEAGTTILGGTGGTVKFR